MIRSLILLVLLQCGWLPSPALGQAFVVISHSDPYFSVYKSDIVDLQVKLGKTSAEFVKIRWVASGKTLCRTASCSIDTADFEVGRHKVFAVLYDELDSHSIRFSFNVLATPEGRKPTKVSPKMVEFEGATRPNADLPGENTVIAALSGSVYRFTSNDLDVIRSKLQTITWQEKLRVAKDSLGWVRWKEADEHFLQAVSKAIFHRLDSGERFLVLETGMLRSRRLKRQSSPLYIMPHPQMQISMDEIADVVVERQPDQVRIFGLRGSVYLDLRGDAGEHFQEIKPGRCIQVSLPSMSKSSCVLDSQAFEKFISETTPELVNLERSSLARAPFTLQALDPEAKSADHLTVGDYVLAIQSMLVTQKSKGNTFLEWPELANAYYEIGLLQAAKAIVDQRPKSFTEHGEHQLILGKIALAIHQYEMAVEALDQASYNYDEDRNLEYYLGIAHFRAQNRMSAQYHLKMASWLAINERQRESIADHLRRLEQETWFKVRFAGGAFYESHVYGLKHSSPANPNEASKEGFGHHLRYGLDFNYYYGEYFKGDLNYSGAGKRFFYQDLANARQQAHLLQLPLQWQMFGTVQEDTGFRLKIVPYAKMESVGPNRALDSLGGTLEMALPGITLAPRIGVAQGLHVDPFPNRDDAISPVTNRYEGRFDQSHSSQDLLLGLTWLKSPQWSFFSDFTMQNRTYKEARADSDLAATLNYSRSFNLRTSVEGGLFYKIRASKPEGEAESKDTIMGLRLNQLIVVTPVMFLEFFQAFSSQDSDQKDRIFEKTELGLGARLEF